jgi:hypothetical protein
VGVLIKPTGGIADTSRRPTEPHSTIAPRHRPTSPTHDTTPRHHRTTPLHVTTARAAIPRRHPAPPYNCRIYPDKNNKIELALKIEPVMAGQIFSTIDFRLHGWAGGQNSFSYQRFRASLPVMRVRVMQNRVYCAVACPTTPLIGVI